MKRNPELAHRVTQLPEVFNLRHKAIDTLTSLGIAVSMLNRADQAPEREIDVEQKIQTLMLEAVYWYGKYYSTKLAKFEELLSDSHHKQSETIEKGNKLLRLTEELKQERGLN